jgi:hypothetical protein
LSAAPELEQFRGLRNFLPRPLEFSIHGGIVSKSTLFDRLNQELEAFGKKAQAALDEGKLQIELLRVKRRRDGAARDLGMLVYRKERGKEVEARRFDALLLRLDDLEVDVARLEGQIAEAKKHRPESGA